MVMDVNRRTVLRLSRYRKALQRFSELGFVKVFSDNLGEAVGVTSAQVRKDFSLFGISGNKRGGYQIDSLLETLQRILGKGRVQKVVVAGAGNIGKALIHYNSFEKEGIQVAAAFDIDPAKIHKKERIPVLSLDEMPRFIQENGIEICIIAVPEIAAQEVCDKMVHAGIKGILNFAPIRLRCGDENVVINNVNLQIELENVIYFVHALGKNQDTAPVMDKIKVNRL